MVSVEKNLVLTSVKEWKRVLVAAALGETRKVGMQGHNQSNLCRADTCYWSHHPDHHHTNRQTPILACHRCTRCCISKQKSVQLAVEAEEWVLVMEVVSWEVATGAAES